MRAPAVSIAVALVFPASWSCDAGGTPSAAAARDSAGIRVVENPGAGDEPIARLDSSYLRIGVMEGEPAYIFARISDLRGLDGGGVAVAEGQAMELRVFDAQGTHVVTFGGQGGGPGEFTNLTSIAGVAHDTVWAWDLPSGRLTSYLTRGTFLEAVTYAGDPRDRLLRVERLPDGTVVAQSRWRSHNPGPVGSFPLTLMRDTIVLHHLDAALTELDTIAVYPAGEALRAVQIQGGGAGPITSVSVIRRQRPFARSGFSAVAPGGVVVAANDTYQWARWNVDGTPRVISRTPASDRPITPQQVAALRERMIAETDNAARRRDIEKTFDDFALPEIMPGFSALQVDALGRVWLAEYLPRPDAPTAWTVFTPQGAVMGRVEVPAGLEVRDIGADYVLGIMRDELDVPYVLRYPLVWLEE